ncbi:hypothetical protein ABTX35_06635 [Streptomyces sp. NPDC096080]|uniref:hypothetical protein n=1 Tax=Streptomyces sp. NPDC096080 TaxID=3156693 RepID=UPI00332DB3DD
MARVTKPAPAPAECPDCKGRGETAETVRVGSARKSRETSDHQTALCLSCWGSGEATD